MSALCRSQRELSNAYLLANFGFDTAENEPCKVCPIERCSGPDRSAGRGGEEDTDLPVYERLFKARSFQHTFKLCSEYCHNLQKLAKFGKVGHCFPQCLARSRLYRQPIFASNISFCSIFEIYKNNLVEFELARLVDI